MSDSWFRKVWTVTSREYRHTVLTKAFLLAAVGVPLLGSFLAFVLPPLLEEAPKPVEGTLVVIDPERTFQDALDYEFDPDVQADELARRRAALESALGDLPPKVRELIEDELERIEGTLVPKIELEHVAEPARIDELKDLARRGDRLGVAVLRDELLAPPAARNQFELFVPDETSRKKLGMIRRPIERAIVRSRTARAGLDPRETEAMVRRPEAATTRLADDGGEAEEDELAGMLIPFAFMFLLWMSTLISGQYLLTSTIEEKSNKVVEVLLSAVSPLQLMTGKILGQGFVGLTMLCIYGAFGATLAHHFDYGHYVPVGLLGFLALYFLIGYFMNAAISASVGGAVNELREAQSLTAPLGVLFMIPMLAWPALADNPGGTFATVLSFVPPVTPFVMILRIASPEPVPGWQIAATLILGFAATVGMVWLCARIFRIGVLMYGKPPGFLELLRWVRYS